MTRKFRILGLIVLVLACLSAALGIGLSYDSPCPQGNSSAAVQNAPPDASAQSRSKSGRMQAVVGRCYGPPAVLQLEEIPRPSPSANQILVKVHAAALNPLDWHYMRGKPYVMRLSTGLGEPKDARVGVDFAGTVEAVGSAVTRFKPGDPVFGGANGSLAEYLVVREDGAVAVKPARISFEQAGSVAVAATTALQGLRDRGKIRAGQKVLINGASGGVGTFAVQIAKAFGAEVTGVCSTRNVELVRSLGADHVVDYTREDFTLGASQYDLILDAVGNHSLRDYRRVLRPDRTLVMIGAVTDDVWLGPLVQPLKGAAVSPFVTQTLATLFAELNAKDIEALRMLLEAGKVVPVIDRQYPLREFRAAMDYLERGRARGKVVMQLATLRGSQ